jgi:hypothetical protein
MSGEGVATERREAEFKVEANSEEALIVLLLAWFKSQMINCELAYQQGDKRALMTALQICFGVWLPAGRSPPNGYGEKLILQYSLTPSRGTMCSASPCGAIGNGRTPHFP